MIFLVATAFFIFIAGASLCLYRAGAGPTSCDRIASVFVLGTLLVSLCAIVAMSTAQSFYINIAFVVAFIIFMIALAAAKFVEGRSLDD